MATGNVNYNAVLADLEARKAQIESAIAAVKTILASAGALRGGRNSLLGHYRIKNNSRLR